MFPGYFARQSSLFSHISHGANSIFFIILMRTRTQACTLSHTHSRKNTITLSTFGTTFFKVERRQFRLECLYSAREKREVIFWFLTQEQNTFVSRLTSTICLVMSHRGKVCLFVNQGRDWPPYSLEWGFKVAAESRCYFSVIVHNSNLNSSQADLLIGGSANFLSCSQV